MLIVVNMFWIFRNFGFKCWFPWVVGGPGVFRKPREACRKNFIQLSPTHAPRDFSMTKNHKHRTVKTLTSIKH